MKIAVDIVTGFLGSGKTTYIHKIIEERKKKQKILVLQWEQGQGSLKAMESLAENVAVEEISPDKGADEELFQGFIEHYKPDRIIVESNGMQFLEPLLRVFEDTALRKKTYFNQIVYILDTKSFKLFFMNMKDLVSEQMSPCDQIVLVNSLQQSAEALKETGQILKSLNPEALKYQMNFVDSVDETGADSQKTQVQMTPYGHQMMIQKFGIAIALLTFVGYGFYSVCQVVDLEGQRWVEMALRFNVVFQSILMQAIPFLLLGVFVSAILQTVVSQEQIIKVFPQKKRLGFLAALVAGVFFPVCDCAIVPVATGLVKKGVDLSTATVFLLVAPLVNPIVIASTLYAFPGQPEIAVYRVGIGAVVALIVGTVVALIFKNQVAVNDNWTPEACTCQYCIEKETESKNVIEKIENVFRHAGAEFFGVGRYLIIGAFVSSLFQTFVPKSVFQALVGHPAMSIMTMMAAAFILSICSTSDAFIARSFTGQFSLGPILGFLVLGPMIDTKNLLMLFAGFKKKFVFQLVMLIVGVSFVVLYGSTAIIMKG